MDFEKFVDRVPSDQAAVDVFKGRWACALPGLAAGESPLFDVDRRPGFALKAFGPEVASFDGAHLLELGPLEAAHTYQLERLGARVTAIEGNAEAYLKCLIVKEIFGLKAAFKLGNYTRFFDESEARFDMVFASGVLYHMIEPLRLIEQICAAADRAFVWTHYYDARYCTGFVEEIEANGVAHFRKDYPNRADGTFYGGLGAGARWLRRDDIFDAFRRAGHAHVEALHDRPDGVNGPSVSFVTRR